MISSSLFWLFWWIFSSRLFSSLPWCSPFNVDRLSDVRPVRVNGSSHYQAFGFASNKLVNRFYAQCIEIAHVKGDDLNRLGSIWYRVDTIEGHFARFDRTRDASLAVGAPFEREERLHALSRAHFHRAAAVDQHLGPARARAVVRRHRHAVRAGRKDGEKVALFDGEGALDAEHVGGFAHRPHHVVALHGARRALLHRDDVVPRLVERGADQLAHRGVDHREALRLVELQVLDAREQDARRADDGAAGLQHHLEAAPGEARGEALAIGAHVERSLVAIADAEAAAQVDVLRLDPFARERIGELQPALDRLVERGCIEDLRSDVAADPDHAQVHERRRVTVGRQRARVRDPELVARHAGGYVGVRLRVDVRVDAKRHRRAHAHGARDGVQALELRLALDVEALDARFQRRAHLGPRLADAGEDHFRGRPARGQHARELASRDDVEPGAQAPQHVEHREVRVGLHRVADEMLHAGEALVELAERVLDRRARIHVAGRAEAPRHLFQRHAFESELALHALKGVHGASDAGLAGVGSGSLSGPFCPQAHSAAARAAAPARAPRRRKAARIMAGIMNESDFHRAVDAVLARVEASVEDLPGLDVDLESGILTVTCPDDSRVIVNRQTPNREIWVAAR